MNKFHRTNNEANQRDCLFCQGIGLTAKEQAGFYICKACKTDYLVFDGQITWWSFSFQYCEKDFCVWWENITDSILSCLVSVDECQVKVICTLPSTYLT